MLTDSTAFNAAIALQLVTVSLFLYLVVYLPWYQGLLPNVSNAARFPALPALHAQLVQLFP